VDFEEHRSHLTSVAYRMLGSAAEAEDAVQEAWLRLARSEVAGVENPRGWLTTVVARICLDQLRARAARRETPVAALPEVPSSGAADPAEEAALADSVGLALLVVLDTLAPAERLAFVLHDLFAVPFEEVARVLDRSPDAARQLASRARRRVRGAAPSADGAAPGRRAVVEAFLAAARGGDLGALVALLDPDVVVRADSFAVASGADAEVGGADAVAAYFSGRARAARVAEVDGVVQLVWSAGGRPRVVFAFTLHGDRVVRIDLVADPERLAAVSLR
jgi:RNA polymerase sigma factor (sigma-70 family)